MAVNLKSINKAYAKLATPDWVEDQSDKYPTVEALVKRFPVTLPVELRKPLLRAVKVLKDVAPTERYDALEGDISDVDALAARVIKSILKDDLIGPEVELTLTEYMLCAQATRLGNLDENFDFSEESLESSDASERDISYIKSHSADYAALAQVFAFEASESRKAAGFGSLYDIYC